MINNSENVVDTSDIVRYADRNTSIKMPIEKKIVSAYLDSLLNSTSVKLLYNKIKSAGLNGDYFSYLMNYHKNCVYFRDEPYRSIIAHSMLKKDEELFVAVSNAFFKGTIGVFQNNELNEFVVEYTDEATQTTKPTDYTTDMGLTTDMGRGLLRVGFFNKYGEGFDAEEDGIQSYEQMMESLDRFWEFIPIVKPARIGVMMIYVTCMEVKFDYFVDNTKPKGKRVVGKVSSRGCDVITAPELWKLVKKQGSPFPTGGSNWDKAPVNITTYRGDSSGWRNIIEYAGEPYAPSAGTLIDKDINIYGPDSGNLSWVSLGRKVIDGRQYEAVTLQYKMHAGEVIKDEICCDIRLENGTVTQYDVVNDTNITIRLRPKNVLRQEMALVYIQNVTILIDWGTNNPLNENNPYPSYSLDV